jgi:hypothetical protein
MMETESTSEMLVNLYQNAWRSNPEVIIFSSCVDDTLKILLQEQIDYFPLTDIQVVGAGGRKLASTEVAWGCTSLIKT